MLTSQAFVSSRILRVTADRLSEPETPLLQRLCQAATHRLTCTAACQCCKNQPYLASYASKATPIIHGPLLQPLHLEQDHSHKRTQHRLHWPSQFPWQSIT